MDTQKLRELAHQAAQACEELDVGVLGDDDAHTARADSIEAAILQALREALGPPTQEMIEAAFDKAELFLDTDEDIADAWTAMAAVRLRGVLSGAKE